MCSKSRTLGRIAQTRRSGHVTTGDQGEGEVPAPAAQRTMHGHVPPTGCDSDGRGNVSPSRPASGGSWVSKIPHTGKSSETVGAFKGAAGDVDSIGPEEDIAERAGEGGTGRNAGTQTAKRKSKSRHQQTGNDRPCTHRIFSRFRAASGGEGSSTGGKG